jgi:hypothetical protein
VFFCEAKKHIRQRTRAVPRGVAYVAVDDEAVTGLPPEVVVVTSMDTGLTD